MNNENVINEFYAKLSFLIDESQFKQFNKNISEVQKSLNDLSNNKLNKIVPELDTSKITKQIKNFKQTISYNLSELNSRIKNIKIGTDDTLNNVLNFKKDIYEKKISPLITSKGIRYNTSYGFISRPPYTPNFTIPGMEESGYMGRILKGDFIKNENPNLEQNELIKQSFLEQRKKYINAITNNPPLLLEYEKKENLFDKTKNKIKDLWENGGRNGGGNGGGNDDYYNKYNKNYNTINYLNQYLPKITMGILSMSGIISGIKSALENYSMLKGFSQIQGLPVTASKRLQLMAQYSNVSFGSIQSALQHISDIQYAEQVGMPMAQQQAIERRIGAKITGWNQEKVLFRYMSALRKTGMRADQQSAEMRKVGFSDELLRLRNVPGLDKYMENFSNNVAGLDKNVDKLREITLNLKNSFESLAASDSVSNFLNKLAEFTDNLKMTSTVLETFGKLSIFSLLAKMFGGDFSTGATVYGSYEVGKYVNKKFLGDRPNNEWWNKGFNIAQDLLMGHLAISGIVNLSSSLKSLIISSGIINPTTAATVATAYGSYKGGKYLGDKVNNYLINKNMNDNDKMNYYLSKIQEQKKITGIADISSFTPEAKKDFKEVSKKLGMENIYNKFKGQENPLENDVFINSLLKSLEKGFDKIVDNISKSLTKDKIKVENQVTFELDGEQFSGVIKEKVNEINNNNYQGYFSR